MVRRTAAGIVVDALRAEGIKVVFGMSGGHVMPIFDALLDTDIRIVNVCHEGNGATMAETYGRLTKTTGVCIFTAGPGATNSVSAVAHAYSVNSPLIHITGSLPTGARKEAMHGVDRPSFLAEIFAPVTKWSIRVEVIEELPHVLQEAFSVAKSGWPGPVHVDIALDIINAEKAIVPEYQISQRTLPLAPDSSSLNRAVSLFSGAERPLIYASRGVGIQGIGEQLIQLAEKTQTPVVTHANSMGLVPTHHPLWGGYLDSWGIPLVTTQLLDSCDFLLSVGAKDETEEIALLKQKGPKSIVLAGTDRTGPLANKEKQLLYLSGNLKTILKELLNKVRRDDGKKVSIRKSVNDLRDFRAKLESKARSLAAEEPIHPAYVACQLAQLFDQETIFTVDSTDSFRWLSLMLPVKGIGSFIQFGSYGCMGLGLPAGIGASLARPDCRVCVVTGDGGFLMACSDFGTAVVEKIPILVVVLNNQKHGMIERLHRISFGRPSRLRVGSPRFAEWAESYGALGFRVEKPQNLQSVLREAWNSDRPAIVEVITGTDYSQVPDDLIPFDFTTAK